MNIIEKSYKWAGGLTKRKSTKYIILHHRAGTGDADSIHKQHIAEGCAGIGYNFYIRTNGEIYRGRPLDTVGAHCKNFNSQSVGICFEGNYDTNNTMPSAQICAGQEIVEYLKRIYPSAEVKRHRDFMATACPGRYFPFDVIKNGAKKEFTCASDIVWALTDIIEINDVPGAIKAVDKAMLNNDPCYWMLRKIANK